MLAWAVLDGRYGYASRGLRLRGVAGGSRVHVVAADLCCTQCLSWQHHIYHHPIICAAIHVCSSRDWPSWAWASQEPLPRLWAPQALRRTLMHWQVGHRRATSVGDLHCAYSRCLRITRDQELAVCTLLAAPADEIGGFCGLAPGSKPSTPAALPERTSSSAGGKGSGPVSGSFDASI